MHKTGLVLEGGGVRGAYTAGALAWFKENDIQFDYHVGISTGGAYLAIHLGGDVETGYRMSTDYAVDSANVGLKALKNCGYFVDGDLIFHHDLRDRMKFRIDQLRKSDLEMELGVYDLGLGKTVYYSNKELDDNLDLIMAGCSLPVASEVVKYRGRKLLDGGITKMIPVERALEKGCTKMLIITTKPAGFVRKPSNGVVRYLMKRKYPDCPKIAEDYKVRHLNYYHQMGIVNDLVSQKKALLISPSSEVKVNRFKGDKEKCRQLYEMGYSDTASRKDEILRFLSE